MTVHDYIYFVAAALVGVVGAARIVRLVTADTFPPSVWLRIKFEDKAGESWGKLITCPWCFGPYSTGLAIGTFLVAHFLLGGAWLTAWWIFYGWMAASYAVSWIVFHDED